MKIKSSPESELDEAVCLQTKIYINKKPSKSIQTKREGVQSQTKYTSEENIQG